jgi:GrpB-like predicted nucleotidyltransferase (UPF0157 family)
VSTLGVAAGEATYNYGHVLTIRPQTHSVHHHLHTMAPPVEDILKDYVHQPLFVERIAFRDHELPVQIVAPNPAWAEVFKTLKARIVAALGDTAVEVHHTGSTSVPDLPAKDIIDIDLVVKDSADESAYADKLEDAGFKFLLREPRWHQHRFFYAEYAYLPHVVNLHVWSPDCAEVARHQIFRERLLSCPEDKALYVEAKNAAAQQTREQEGNLLDYNMRKEETIKRILRNAFEELGYI